MSADKPKVMPLGPGEAVLVDAVGAVAARMQPSDEAGLILDVVGKLNHQQARVHRRFVLTVAQAAELIVCLTVAATTAESEVDDVDLFRREFEAAMAREQARLRADVG